MDASDFHAFPQIVLLLTELSIFVVHNGTIGTVQQQHGKLKKQTLINYFLRFSQTPVSQKWLQNNVDRWLNCCRGRQTHAHSQACTLARTHTHALAHKSSKAMDERRLQSPLTQSFLTRRFRATSRESGTKEPKSVSSQKASKSRSRTRSERERECVWVFLRWRHPTRRFGVSALLRKKAELLFWSSVPFYPGPPPLLAPLPPPACLFS